MDNPEKQALVAEFEKTLISKPVAFTYQYIDAIRRSKVGDMDVDLDVPTSTPMYTSKIMKCVDEETGMSWDCYGKNLILDVIDSIGQSAGVRSHRDFQQFIVTEKIAIDTLGAVTKENSEQLVFKSISYEQALAFYNWKNPIHKAEISWSACVFPSREEFDAIRKGESMLLPRREFPLPTPSFRYVIRLD